MKKLLTLAVLWVSLALLAGCTAKPAIEETTEVTPEATVEVTPEATTVEVAPEATVEVAPEAQPAAEAAIAE